MPRKLQGVSGKVENSMTPEPPELSGKVDNFTEPPELTLRQQELYGLRRYNSAPQQQQLEHEQPRENVTRPSSTQMVERGPVPGLDIWRAPAAAVRSALAEVRPYFYSSSNKSSSDMFEVGWSFRAIEQNGVMRIGKPLEDFSCLRALIQEIIEAITPDDAIFGEETINIICRRYTKGQSLPKHLDRPQLFDEHVYGCVLHNTSDRSLFFEQQKRATDEVIVPYTLNEQPGVCFRTQGPSRYEWIHGVDELSHGERISITWRWIQESVAVEGREAAKKKGDAKGGSKGKGKSRGKSKGKAAQQGEKKQKETSDEPSAAEKDGAQISVAQDQESRQNRWGRSKR